MRKLFIATILIAAAALPAGAQNGYSSFIESIKTNSPTANALRATLEAEVKSSRVGLAPENPEADIAYFINRKTSFELNVTQSFDFPTAYAHRAKLARLSSEYSVAQFENGLKSVVGNATELYLNSIYYNKKLALVRRNLDIARSLRDMYQRRVTSGDATILEKNKIEALFLDASTSLFLLEAEKNSIDEAIKSSNGGLAYVIRDTLYPYFNIGSMDDYAQRALDANYEMRLSAIDTLSTQRQIKLNRSGWLPGVKVGYRMNMESKSPTSGVIAGITIPLWQNIGAVKAARLNNKAAVAKSYSTRSLLEVEFERLMGRYTSLSQALDKYSTFTERTSSIALLTKALEAGEISMLEYFVELNIWYDISMKMVDLEYNCAQTAAQMYNLL